MSPRSAALRLGTYYAALFVAVGIHIPFWPLWLQDRGLSASEIGWVAAAGYLVRILASPVIGHLADHGGERRTLMIRLALATALIWLAFPLAGGFWPILVLSVVATFPFAGMIPLGDTLAMMVVGRHGLDYGRARLWGSLAFIIAATLLGKALESWPVAALPWLMAAALLLTAVTCFGLPDLKVPRHEGKPPSLRPVLLHPLFLLFVGAAALNQMAHTVYYAFATIHWKAAGLSDMVIGLLWSEGVVAEIVLFAVSNRVVARFGPAALLLAAALGGAVRWLVLGATADLTLVALSQLLHAATFGCAHLGAIHFIARAVPQGLSARTQGVFAAIAIGLAPGLITPFSGRLYESLGGGSFLAMAALSALSALLAWALMRRWTTGSRIIE
ncbi:major facilitator superfamily permease [Paramagnetospirillum caucaseum]|uniref:Major facilitator superfamily permease n=1 Tax=Paramagnetospirillum caucaseum TaxID=1244869 RepID=M2ZVQ3_9PROT|nr:3-phenylpropionate MFS transporter [Paramagnetospirillum caucaseum]EME71472.1 major facilitator superfamily permease [Paramagnetospirillum caucaseum]